MTGPASWADAEPLFLAMLSADGLTAPTVKGYRQHVRWVAADLGGNPWTISGGELTEWIDSKSWSTSTRSKVVVTMRRFYAWGVAAGWCSWSPAAALARGEHLRRGPKRRPLPPGWREPVGEYLTYLRAGNRRPGTISTHRDRLVQLAECAPDPASVTVGQLAEWQSREGLAPETMRSMRGVIVSFFGWCEQTGRVDVSPAVGLPKVLQRRVIPKAVPDDQLLATLASCDDRTRIAILLGALAGLRRSEIAQVHLGRDITERDLIVRATGAKGGHERIVPLHPTLASELAAERHRRREGGSGSGFGGWAVDHHPDPDGWLFPSDRTDAPLTGRHMSKIISAALPRGLTAHSLRHRFATVSYDRGGRDLRAVQELLGHASPAVAARYVRSSAESQQRAVAAVGLDLRPTQRLEAAR